MSTEQPEVVRLSVNLAPDTAQYLKSTADALGVSVTEMIRRCISLDKQVRDEQEAGNKVRVTDEGMTWYRSVIL